MFEIAGSIPQLTEGAIHKIFSKGRNKTLVVNKTLCTQAGVKAADFQDKRISRRGKKKVNSFDVPPLF
jgi:hypothetical protein